MKYSANIIDIYPKITQTIQKIALDSLLSIADIETTVPIKQSDPPIIKETQF